MNRYLHGDIRFFFQNLFLEILEHQQFFSANAASYFLLISQPLTFTYFHVWYVFARFCSLRIVHVRNGLEKLRLRRPTSKGSSSNKGVRAFAIGVSFVLSLCAQSLKVLKVN